MVITITRKKVTYEATRIFLTPEKDGTKLSLEALSLNKDNFNKFQKKYNLPEKNLEIEILEDEFSSIKINRTTQQKKELIEELTKQLKEEEEEIIGEINFNIEGSGSNYKYKSNPFVEYDIGMTVSRQKLFDLFLEKDITVENFEEMITLYESFDEEKQEEISMEYLIKYYDAPTEIKDCSYHTSGGDESDVLHWLPYFAKVNLEEIETDVKYPSIALDWEVDIIYFK